MIMETFTRLTVEQPDLKVTWEVPYNDVNGEDMMNAIRTIMVGMTFHPETVYRAMREYAEEHSENIENNNYNFEEE